VLAPLSGAEREVSRVEQLFRRHRDPEESQEPQGT
jgi:hypothetical protein